MNTRKTVKIAGLLLLIGPLVDLVVSISRPGSFPGDHPDGAQGAMQAGVQSAASNSAMVQLMVDLGFIASFGLLFGFWCVSRFMSDSDGRAHLRKAGLMILTVALAVRTASFGMGLLLATTLKFSPPGALEAGPALDTAVMFLVMEGSFSVFATILNLAGVALFATSVMNANLMGSNNLPDRPAGGGPGGDRSHPVARGAVPGEQHLRGLRHRQHGCAGAGTLDHRLWGGPDQEERHHGHDRLTSPGRLPRTSPNR